MAVRARPDNLGLDHPGEAVADGAAAFAFEELWEHRDDVRAVSRRIVGDAARADDVVQDTFLRALDTAGRLDRRVSFAPWLATVARRRSIDRLRADSRARLVAALPERAGAAGDDPVEQVLQQERLDRVRAALATLGARERQLLLRQITHGLSLAELAAEEATSVASVRSVLSRARTKLRVALERGGPLGVAPGAGLVAAVKRRLHRWAARFEGSTPMLAGAGAQFGDVVVAAVAAAVLLLAGTTPAPEQPTTIAMASTGHAAQASPSTGDRDRHRPEPRPGPRRDEDRPRRDDRPRHDDGHPLGNPLAQPPPVDLPGMPADGADQPEEVFVEHIAASDDGRTLVIGGNKQVAAGSHGGTGLYRSDDGGHTWRWLQAGGYVYGNPLFRGGTLFVASDPALLRSDDDGRNFVPVSSSRGGVTAVSRDPQDSRIFLAPAGLLAYDARTGTTTPYAATPASMELGGMAVRLTPASLEFLLGISTYTSTGMLQGYVQRCTTTACGTPVPLPGVSRSPKVLVSSATDGLVLAWDGHRLFRSTDGGTTFAAVAMTPGAIHTVVEGATGELLLARANLADTTSSGLLRSVDGGATWTPLAMATPLQQGAEGLASLPNGRIVAGLSGLPGIRCSVDGGLTWAPRCPAL